MLYSPDDGRPIAIVYELNTRDSNVVDLPCVPGIGLVGLLISLDPNMPKGICCGVLSRPKSVPLFDMKHWLCIHFWPGEFTRIFGIPSNELTDTEILLTDLFLTGTFIEELSVTKNFEERFKLVSYFVEHWQKGIRTFIPNQLTQLVMHQAIVSHGNVRMNELERQTGYSERYLRKIILERVGLTPKETLENIKFQNVLHLMVDNPNLSLAEIAQNGGYYDQAHFTKIFKGYMGVTPSVFSKHICKLFYSPIILGQNKIPNSNNKLR